MRRATSTTATVASSVSVNRVSRARTYNLLLVNDGVVMVAVTAALFAIGIAEPVAILWHIVAGDCVLAAFHP